MQKPPLLAVASLIAGASLLVAAATGAAPSRFKQGGTLRVNLPSYDIDDIDPSIAYGTVSWHIEYSTALKLLNYPDAPAPRGSRLLPEGASSFRVSPNGRTYTFTIRTGFRFSNGARVTARNYAYALRRAMSRDIGSPGFQFIADANATNIVGAQDVWNGSHLAARGVRVLGNKLFVQLTRPDGTLIPKLAMPFFQAMPLSLSLTEKVINVDRSRRLPSAGPYYVSEREPNQIVTIERNPFYGGARPRRLARIDIKVAVNRDTSYQEVRANQADYAYDLPVGAPAQLGREFGLQGRFRVRTANCLSYIALNSMSPLFRDNPQLRRAVNYVIDRNAMAALYGPYARIPTDQYLPRGFPGFKDIAAYPMMPDLAKARALANGRVPSGGPWVFYYGRTAPGRELMERVRGSLSQIGITVHPRPLYNWIGGYPNLRTPDWAFASSFGWCQDFSDPYDFINVLLHTPANLENNNNVANFEDPAYDARMDRAARLAGSARLRAYERLEHDLVRKAAPWAAWGQPANQLFFSDSVDMRSFVYQPIYESPPYNLLALK